MNKNKVIKLSYKICKKCNYVCYTIHFQQNFKNWTSGNDDIDKFIQDTQLSTHENPSKALEWIPYDRFYNIKNITEGRYKANWIDGNISYLSYWSGYWKRINQNMIVELKILNNPKSITLEFVDEINKVYGITQDPETLNYIMVLSGECKKCNNTSCYAKQFQQNFNNWTCGNVDIDKLIRNTQLSAHDGPEEALEWISYDRFYNVKNIADDKYKANWIDGNIIYWNDDNQNWERKSQNMIVELKRLNNSKEITLEFINETKIDYVFYGITQNPETKDYIMVLRNKCKQCNYTCYAMYFQQYFNNWTSGNDDLDKFIHDTQLLEHTNDYVRNALEWIPYDKLYNIKYTTENKYSANWIDGNISYWDDDNQNWRRIGQNMIVELKRLNNTKELTLEFMNETKIDYSFYGITQNPETKIYMMVVNERCKKCNYTCYSKLFQQNFLNWTSGNHDIDKFIQDTQLSTHKDTKNTLEWILYDKFYNIESIEEDTYRANWIDGNIFDWDHINQNWERKGKNMIVKLKIFNNLKNNIFELANKVKIDYIFYGITQDPETKDYIMVLGDKCKKCNYTCYTIHFQQNFINWTSDNEDIDKFIQDTQLSTHEDKKKALEWIPYDKFYNIKCIAENRYQANWIDGYMWDWDSNNQNWTRVSQNMIVELKRLNNIKNITLEFMNEIKIDYVFYGITKDPETKNYMMVLNEKCKRCNDICYTIRFQQNFINWTSDNDDIDKFIQDTQCSAHYDMENVLEWISYDKFYNIKCITENKYKANWIDGNISYWHHDNQNWEREDQNMIVELKKLNNPKDIALEFINKVNKAYGITQNPETKDYMVVLNEKCKECDYICYSKRFQQNFNNWTSGNDDIDKFIQDTQLSAHKDVKNILEWIPYDKFYDIKYIAEGGFGKVYRANWIDGYMNKWDKHNKNWERSDQNRFVALKSLNNSSNVTLEFMNEITSHRQVYEKIFYIKYYGITQDPETKNYMMVLDYAESGSLRDYLNKNYNELTWNVKINYLHNIASGLYNIHNNELFHQNLHTGNILKNYEDILTGDIGLCKPADYNTWEIPKNSIYGVLPYIAPEILRGQSYTKAADIYSFGIIMYEIISGLPPYYDLSHDNNLAIKICQGLRPRFDTGVSQSIIHLIKRCLDANSSIRPTAIEIIDELWEINMSNLKQNKEIKEEINDNLPISNKSLTSLSYKTHPEAIYSSRLLNFDNLPEPKNSDDYYEQNDDIISEKFSESLN
ncbi:unnamed protein product [Rhizophagus irregularis]|nr:unnamed protein product [Rhizophagus irregularis]